MDFFIFSFVVAALGASSGVVRAESVVNASGGVDCLVVDVDGMS